MQSFCKAKTRFLAQLGDNNLADDYRNMEALHHYLNVESVISLLLLKFSLCDLSLPCSVITCVTAIMILL